MGGMGSGYRREPLEVVCATCGGRFWYRPSTKPRRYCSHECYPAKQKQYGPAIPTGLKREVRRSNKREKMAAAKSDRGACMDCGMLVEERTMPCFAWDHREPLEKSFTIARAMQENRNNWDEIAAELEKCDLVCHNCHALRTHRGNHWAFRRSSKAQESATLRR